MPGSPIAQRTVLLTAAAAVLVVVAALIFLGMGRSAPGTATASRVPNLAPNTAGSEPSEPGTPSTEASPSTPTSTASPGLTPLPTPTPTPTTKTASAPSVEPEELTGYVWPLRNALLTSRMAARDFGGFVVIDGRDVHDGIDLATRCGDDIRAAHDGTVLYAGRNFDVYLGYRGKPEQIYARLEQQGRVNTLPIVIVIDDGNGYRSVYVHLKKANVEAGDLVKAGDVIGAEGATGYATGCHLHYGLIRMDSGWQEVVPSLARFGYPPFVRERIDPLRVLPWADRHAPRKLQDRVNASPSPSASPAA